MLWDQLASAPQALLKRSALKGPTGSFTNIAMPILEEILFDTRWELEALSIGPQ